MKKFLIMSAGAAIAMAVLSIDFLPVTCDVCGDKVFRTDITSTCCNAHGDVVHQDCCAEFRAVPGMEYRAPTATAVIPVRPGTLVEQESETLAAAAAILGQR